MMNIYVIRGWIFVRPIRWFTRKVSSGTYLRLWPKKCEYYHPEFYPYKYDMPNLHWWALDKTFGRFTRWIYWEWWRPFCDWTGGWRRTYPPIASFIHEVGRFLTYPYYGGACYHCAAVDADPSELTESDETFQLTDSGTSYTPEGTDHWFRGITTCPHCGYKSEFGDSSL